MELPPGSPQLDVPAVRLHGRGLYVLFSATCPLHIFSVNWIAVCWSMSLKKKLVEEMLVYIYVSGQPRRMEGIMVTTVRDFNILGSACR